MSSKGAPAVALAAALLVLAGCGAPLAGRGGGTPPATPPAQPPASDPAGSRAAPGLYELSDGSWRAIGTLEYRDLEGGTWVVVGGTEAGGDLGTVVAVIANPADLGSRLEALKGAVVAATGARLEGASIRMAGPEIKVATIEAIDDASGPAQ